MKEIRTRIRDILTFRCCFEDGDEGDIISVIREKIRDIRRTSGMIPLNVTLPFLSNDDVIIWRSYEAGALEEFNLDEVVYRGGSGEEEIVTESVVIRGPFTIHARDFTGGNGENLAPPNNYTIVKIPGKNNDCLIDCFNYFCRESRDPRLVREAIGCNHDRALAPKWIPKLEEYFKINVCVVEDYHNRTNEYFSYGQDCDNKILYHGKHYSVVKDKLPTIEVDEYEDEKLDTFYYFFDYETVYDPYTYKLEPYSWAMVKYNNKREKMQEWFCTFDEEELARLLFLEANKHEKDNLILVGYNNSRFDNFFLLNLALKYELNIFKTLFVNNTILGMNIEGFNVKDLCRILNMPLRKALTSFK
ncbi:hypothetical protein IWW42_005850, partial [Coemansia sp. RSA 1085]